MYTVLNATRDWTNPEKIMSGNFGHVLGFEQTCQYANKYKYDGINIDLEGNCEFSPTKIKTMLEEYKLIPCSFGVCVNFTGNHEAFNQSVEKFKSQAAVAAIIGCKIALCYITPFSDISFDSMFKQYVDRLKKISPILKKYSIKIAFEFIGPAETRINSRYDFIHTIDGVRSLISATNLYGIAGIKLDSHHWYYSGATALDLKHLDLEYIIYIELNDSLPGYDTLSVPEFDRRLPFKTNVTPLNDFMIELARKNYVGPLVVEPWDKTLFEMSPDSAIKLARASLDECIKEAVNGV